MRLVVLDAAAAVEYLLQTPGAPAIARIVEDRAVDLHVPALCDVEVTPALRRAVLQRRLPPARAEDALGDYLDLPLRRHGHAALLPRILALRDNFSAYDACYAALAERLGADLLTGDGALARTRPGGSEPDDRMFRFSLAGIQLKFSAVAEAQGGLTIPVTGVGGDWIAKLPSTFYAAVPENEYVMLELARAAGVTAPEARLVSLTDLQGLPAGAFAGTGRALAVRRFDRGPGGIRIHMEDFAQVFGKYPAEKYGRASYEDIARVLWAETGEPGVTQLARRLAVITLVGNADMHLKNWSVLYPDRRTPVLSPAYDMVSTIPYIPEPELALSLGETKSMLEVDEDRFRRFAQRAGLPDRIVVAAARDATERLREAWRTHPATDLLPRFVRDAVSAHLDRAPLGR